MKKLRLRPGLCLLSNVTRPMQMALVVEAHAHIERLSCYLSHIKLQLIVFFVVPMQTLSGAVN